MSTPASRLAVVNGGAPVRQARPLLSHSRRRLLLDWLLYEDANERALQDYDDRMARTEAEDESACA